MAVYTLVTVIFGLFVCIYTQASAVSVPHPPCCVSPEPGAHSHCYVELPTFFLFHSFRVLLNYLLLAL